MQTEALRTFVSVQTAFRDPHYANVLVCGYFEPCWWY